MQLSAKIEGITKPKFITLIEKNIVNLDITQRNVLKSLLLHAYNLMNMEFLNGRVPDLQKHNYNINSFLLNKVVKQMYAFELGLEFAGVATEDNTALDTIRAILTEYSKRFIEYQADSIISTHIPEHITSRAIQDIIEGDKQTNPDTLAENIVESYESAQGKSTAEINDISRFTTSLKFWDKNNYVNPVEIIKIYAADLPIIDRGAFKNSIVRAIIADRARGNFEMA